MSELEQAKEETKRVRKRGRRAIGLTMLIALLIGAGTLSWAKKRMTAAEGEFGRYLEFRFAAADIVAKEKIEAREECEAKAREECEAKACGEKALPAGIFDQEHVR